MKILSQSIFVLFFSLCVSPLLSQIECDDTVPILGFEFQIDSPGLPADPNIYAGDEFCVNFVATNLVDIDIMQFLLGFNPNVVEFIENGNNPCLGPLMPPGSEISISADRIDQGIITVLWNNFNGESTTLADGEVFAKFCFEALQAPGECTSLVALDGNVNNPPFYTLVQSSESPTEFCSMDSIAFNTNNIELCIDCDRPTVSDLNICGTGFCFGACATNYPVNFVIMGDAGPLIDRDLMTPDDVFCQGPGLPSGLYTIEMTDALGNAGNITFFELDATAAPLNIDTTLTNPRCANTRDGMIAYSISGGVSDYSLQLSNGVFYEGDANTIENLTVGTYSLTVTDALGCSAELENLVLNTPPIVIETMVDSFFCLYDPNGSLTATASGGTPFPGNEYEFNNGMPSSSFTQVDPMGTFSFDEDNICYNVKVVDAVGCPVEECIPIPLENILPLELDTVPGDCSIPGYSALLKLVNFPDIARINSRLTLIGEGSIPTAVGNLCAIAGSGPALGLPGGDTGVYLGPGDYEWVITLLDRNDPTITLCQETFSFEIPDFTLDTLLLKPLATQPDCGMENGSATVEPMGGQAPYSFEWAYDPTLDQPTLTNLPSGVYDVTVTDNSGCEKDTFVDLQQADFLEVEAFLNTDLDCSDPTVLAEMEAVTNGYPVADLSFTWSTENEADLGNTPILQTDSAGTYIIRVATFFDACVVTDTVVIEEPSILDFEVRVQNPASCDISNPTVGEIEITNIMGGSGNYRCVWFYEGVELPPVTPGIFVHDRTNLIPGLYEILIIDNMTGCVSAEIIELRNDDQVAFDVALTPPSCPGFADGIIAVEGPPNGSALICVWEDMNITTTACVATNLEAGSYEVNVADENGCNKDTIITLMDPIIFTAEVVIDNQGVCFGIPDATVTANVLTTPNNTTTFGYVWSDGAATSDGLSNTNAMMPVGAQSVIISDADNCTLEIEFDITDPLLIELDGASAQGVNLCVGECNGAVDLTAEGGTGNPSNYIFTWELDGTETASRADLCIGRYPISITDEAGCTVLDTVTIIEPDSLLVSVANKVNIGCNNSGGGGSLTIAATGGCGNYSYLWPQNLSTTETATGLAPGVYEVTVVDDCGCEQMITDEILDGDMLFAELNDLSPPNCDGETVCLGINNQTISGGDGSNYTFSINSGLNGARIPIDSCVQVLPGQYTVDVFDATGDCRLTIGPFDIDNAAPFSVDLGPDIIVDIGEETLEIEADIVSTAAISEINWLPTDDISCIDSSYCNIIQYTPSVNTILTVEVIDENGCVTTDEIIIDLDTPRRVYPPTIFDPNSSIDNRFMLLTGRGVQRIEDFEIYDRWGNLMYKLAEEFKDFPHSKDDGWDGRKNNRDAENGVYVWIANVTFVDGQTIPYKGQVTLIR